MSAPACRADCGAPLDPTLIEADGTGLHPTCVAPVEPMLPTVRAVLSRHQAGQDRSRQRAVGPSEIGDPCDRALAYRLFGVPKVSDDALKWAPLVGTWGHAGLALAFAEENKRLGRPRYLIEQRVMLPSTLVPGGTCDLFDTDTGEACDWKFTGKTATNDYRLHGPSPTYRVQAHVYGLGWALAGHDVRSVRIVYLPRWSHLLSDGHEWAEPFDRALAELALERVAAVRSLGDVLDVDRNPDRYALVTALPTKKCERRCSWYRAWPASTGPADDTGCPGLGPQ